jgi:hypothetical protein
MSLLCFFRLHSLLEVLQSIAVKKKHDQSAHNQCEANMVYSVRIQPHPDDEKRNADEQAYRKKQLDSATILNWISGAGAAIALLALVGLILNAWIIHQQLQVMVDSNKISRTANIVSQRAFVFILEPPQIDHANEPQMGKGWAFTYQMENSGNTPARNVRHYINSNLSRSNVTWERLPGNFTFPDNPSSGGPFPNSVMNAGLHIIAPQQKLDFTQLWIPTDVLERVTAGTAHVYFWGWVAYDDVFGCGHKTEFAIEVVSMQRIFPNKDLERFFFNTYPDHNCTDKDCKDFEPSKNPECPN